jgi:hypothetical protein
VPDEVNAVVPAQECGVVETTVDAEADANPVGLRVQVYVGGALADRVAQQDVAEGRITAVRRPGTRCDRAGWRVVCASCWFMGPPLSCVRSTSL